MNSGQSFCLHCSKCGSKKITDIKKVGKKEVQLLHIQIRDLQEDLRKHKETVAEDFKSAGDDMKSLYRYLEEIVAILKENELIPEPREKMVSSTGKKKRLYCKNNISKVIKKQSIVNENLQNYWCTTLLRQCIKSSVKSELLTIISFAKNRFMSLQPQGFNVKPDCFPEFSIISALICLFRT